MRLSVREFTTRELAAATVGCIGVALIGFDASPFGPAPFYIGLSLLLLGLPLLPWRNFRERAKDPIVWIILLLAVWVLVRSAADLIYPTMSPDQFNSESWWSFFRISGIFSLLIGVWVAFFPRAGMLGIGAMIISMISNAIVYRFWNELARAFSSGYRFEGEAACNSMGAFTAPMPAIGILVAVLGGAWLFAKRQKFLGSILILICTYYTVTNTLILIATKSRHNWIAALVALFVAFVLIFRNCYSQKHLKVKHLLWIILPLVIITSLTVGLKWNMIAKRWQGEIQTIQALLTFNPEQIEKRSLGKRYIMWKFGVDNLKQYPLVGWGPGYTRATFDLTKISWLGKHDGYHNLYIQLAVTMGIIWAFLWIFYHFILFIRWKRGIDEMHFYNVLIGGIIVLTLLVSGVAEFRFFGVNGTDLYVFGTGIFLGGVLVSKKNSESAIQKHGSDQ